MHSSLYGIATDSVWNSHMLTVAIQWVGKRNLHNIYAVTKTTAEVVLCTGKYNTSDTDKSWSTKS